MKIQDIRKMKTEELDKKLSELRLELSKELGNVKMGRAVKNPGKIKELKKSIARIMTIKQELKAKAPTKKAETKKAETKKTGKPVKRLK